MAKLSNMNIDLVSLVDRAANKKRWYLKKGIQTMTKELALKLVGANLSAEEVAAIIAMVPEADQAEVKAAFEAKAPEAPKADEVIVEEIAAACSNKMTKANGEQFKGVEDAIAALKTQLETVMTVISEMKAPKEAASSETNKVEEPKAPEAKAPEAKEPTAEAPKEEKEPEITADDLKKMIAEALKR